MGLLGESVERVEAMPGPAWLRDGLGVVGYVLFFIFPLGVLVVLLSSAQIFVDRDAMNTAHVTLVVGYLALIGMAVRLSPAPRHFTWGRWLLIFVTVPVVLLTARLLPEHRAAFWQKAVIYGFCGAGLLQALSVFGLLGGRRVVVLAVSGAFFLFSVALAFLFFRPVMGLELLGLAIFSWLMVGEYLDEPSPSRAVPGWLPRRVRRIFGKPENVLAEAVHGPLLLRKTRQGYSAEIVKDEWGRKGSCTVSQDAHGLPVMAWVEPRRCPDALDAGALSFLSTVRSVSWVRRALFVHLDQQEGPLLVAFETAAAKRQWPIFILCFLACLVYAGALATARAPFASDPYLECLPYLMPLVLLGTLYFEFAMRPDDVGDALTVRPWRALESFESVNAADRYVQPEDYLDEGAIMAYFERSLASMEVLRGIFTRGAMIEFTRAFVWEFLERRKEILLALEEKLPAPAPKPVPERQDPPANRPGRL